MAEVDLYAQEMIRKEREKQISVQIFSLVILVLIGLVAGLAVSYYRKRKAHIQEIHHLRQQLFAQIQSINQQNEDLQQVISKEATTQENETLEFDIEQAQANEEDIQYLRKFNLAYKEQWSVFKEVFLKVYPVFEQNLIAKIGIVSNAELRLLMLHKLGLSNHEISNSLLISPDSVRTGKYRLYKKFGISSNEELDKIL